MFSLLQNGDTGVHVAAEKGHADCLRVLAAAGADKEARNNVRRPSVLREDGSADCSSH